jgi:hypothetical protein
LGGRVGGVVSGTVDDVDVVDVEVVVGPGVVVDVVDVEVVVGPGSVAAPA